MLRINNGLSTQRGEGEVHFFLLVLIATGLFSGAVWLFGWIKDTKNARHYPREMLEEDLPSKYDPNHQTYQVQYGGW